MEIILLIAFELVCILLWSMVIWGGWAEKVHDKFKDQKYVWFWMRSFSIKETRENHIKFLKLISTIGIVIMILLTVIPLLIVELN